MKPAPDTGAYHQSTISTRPVISKIPAPRPLPWNEGTLANGLPVYGVPDRSLPWVSIRVVIAAGAATDGDRPGLTDFTAGLLSSGAGERDAVDFARDIEYFGADLGAEAGFDSVVVELGTLRRYLGEGLDLLGDLLLRPRFEEEEIERDRSQHIAGLRSLHSESDWLADTAVRRHVMAGTPYASPIEGREETIRDLSRDEVSACHRRLLAAPAFIVACGDVDLDQLCEMLDQRIGAIEMNGQQPLCESKAQSGPISGETILVDRHGSTHTSLRLARPGIPRRHPDYTPLRLLTTILGDYFNSRLNNRLREDLGYTYGAWASLEGRVHGGAIWIGTSVASEQVEGTIRTIREEIERIGSEAITSEELELVTRYMAGRHALSRETPEQVGGLISSLLLFDLPRDYYSRTLAEVRELTPERLLETARKYFRPDEFTVVAAGEAERLREPLGKSGSVIVEI